VALIPPLASLAKIGALPGHVKTKTRLREVARAGHGTGIDETKCNYR
jgi:hypothetical protein